MDNIRKTTDGLGTLFLIDTRPRLNAMANKIQGKGFEDARYYENMQFYSFDIENIHKMRDSQLRLIEGVFKSS
jgi:myotubularin-related protein 6/7/8